MSIWEVQSGDVEWLEPQGTAMKVANIQKQLGRFCLRSNLLFNNKLPHHSSIFMLEDMTVIHIRVALIYVIGEAHDDSYPLTGANCHSVFPA